MHTPRSLLSNSTGYSGSGLRASTFYTKLISQDFPVSSNGANQLPVTQVSSLESHFSPKHSVDGSLNTYSTSARSSDLLCNLSLDSQPAPLVFLFPVVLSPIHPTHCWWGHLSKTEIPTIIAPPLQPTSSTYGVTCPTPTHGTKSGEFFKACHVMSFTSGLNLLSSNAFAHISTNHQPLPSAQRALDCPGTPRHLQDTMSVSLS